ncbi:MAG: ABC transporter permease [Desulfurivibrionaceae bacterium]
MITISGLARKNIRGNLFRSIAIVVAVAAATGTIFSVSAVMQSVKTSLTRNAARLGADLIVVPAEHKIAAEEAMAEGRPITFYLAGSVLDEISQVELYHRKLKRKAKVVKEAAAQLFYLSSGAGCCDLAGRLLVGFDPGDDFSVLPWLKGSGKKSGLASGEVLVGHNIPHQQDFKIQLYNRIFTVRGKLEASGNGFLDDSIFMSHADLKDLMIKSSTPLPDHLGWDREIVSAILVRTNPLFNTQVIANQIAHDVKGVKAVVAKQVQTSVGKQLFLLLRAVFLAGGVLWIISFLLIAVIFSMIVNERIREMGLLRAMGAQRKTIFRLTVTEASLLSFAGGSLGIIIGGVMFFSLRNHIETSFAIPFQWPDVSQFSLLIVFCLGLGVLTGVCAALLPAIRCSLMDPDKALLKGE